MVSPPDYGPTFTVDGFRQLRHVSLLHMRGRERISEPFEYELTLLAGTPSDTLNTADILGSSVTVTLTVDSTTRHYNGVVAEFGHTGGAGTGHQEYRAVLRPSFWLYTRRADCRIFQNKTTPEIFSEVCEKGVPFPVRKELTAGAHKAWEYRVQYDESDFDFLSRLLEHEGIYYYFEHSAGKHEMVLVDDVARLRDVKGYSAVPYFPRTGSALRRERDHLYSWAVHDSFQPAAFATADFNFEKPSDTVSGASSVPGRKDSAKYEVFEYPAAATLLERGDVEALAKLRSQQFHSAQSIARGEGDALGLSAGHTFRLGNHPRADLNKRYVVLDTQFEARWPTRDSAGVLSTPEFHIRLEAVDAAVQFRPARKTPKSRIHGTQTARVVGPKEKEVWTDRYGRVKVVFPWDRGAKGDGNSSCWVRVAQGWAGPGWGMQFVPRVDQEVIVSFLEGDPDRPLVIGTVFNGTFLPPYELPTLSHRSGIRTRSLKANGTTSYSEVRFDDKEGAEELYLHAERDMKVFVENNQTITIGETKKDKGNRTTTVQNDDTLTVTNDLTVTVKHKETRTVEGPRATKITADDKLEAKQLTLIATDSITLECGQSKLVLSKDGTIEISGKDVKVKGLASTKIEATKIEVEAGAELKVKGANAAVEGSAMLDLKGGAVASLKGGVTKIG